MTQIARSRIVRSIACCLVCMGILCARLLHVLGIRGGEYRAHADENRYFTLPIPARRGSIVDRNGVRLASDEPVFFLASSSAQLLFANAWSLQKIEVNELPNLLHTQSASIHVRLQRSKDVSPALSHVVGYMGYQDIGENRENSDAADLQIGRTGVENTAQERLRGRDGKEVVEISAKGVITRRLYRLQEPYDGEHVQLTVDKNLQEFALAQLDGRSGAVVVIDATRSSVLAIVSGPSFDIKNIQSALTDEKKPLLNRALRAYPPGSTWKMMTALAALESGKVDTTTTITDTGQIQAGAQVFGNWYWRQYGRTEGSLTLQRAIARSNDIFFYTIAQTVGPDAIAAVAREFGFGKPTGIELPYESQGSVPSPDWKAQKYQEKWYLGDTYNMGIGQGYVLASPIQVANMTAAIARGGNWCTLTLFTKTAVSCTQSQVQQASIDTVISGMIDTCSPGGTGTAFFEWNNSATDEKKIACKTGTAEYGSENEQRKKRTHGWFTLAYPARNPKVAITVFIESTKEAPYIEGSRDAGPIARAVFDAWRQQYE